MAVSTARGATVSARRSSFSRNSWKSSPFRRSLWPSRVTDLTLSRGMKPGSEFRDLA
jgi:hypothetical protein